MTQKYYYFKNKYVCERCKGTGEEPEAVPSDYIVTGPSQEPDPLLSNFAKVLDEHRESIPVVIMDHIDKLQRQIDFSRGGKFGQPTPEPQGFDEWVKAFLPRPIGISDPIWNDHVQTLKSAFNAGQASKPKAKTLEWEKDSDDGWTAQSPIGEFNVYYCSDYGWLCAIDGCDDVWVKYPSGDDGFATPEFAKGECKRHVQALYDSMGVK